MFDNKYGVIPMLNMQDGKEVYAVMLFDGHSFPEAGVYKSKERAERVAKQLNNEKLNDDGIHKKRC